MLLKFLVSYFSALGFEFRRFDLLLSVMVGGDRWVDRMSRIPYFIYT
jgi:hypothetical protein